MANDEAQEKKVTTDEAINVLKEETLKNRKQCGEKIKAILDEHGLIMEVVHTVTFIPKKK